MKIYDKEEGEFHVFLTSAEEGGKRSASHPADEPPVPRL
jgi:hypothetical protein